MVAIKKHYGDDYHTFQELKNQNRKDYNLSKKRIDLSIPTPESLLQYENIEEGFIRRLLKSSELEQQNRHRLEHKQVNNYWRLKRLTLIINGIIASTVATASYFLTICGEKNIALVLLILSFLYLITNTISNRKK